MIAAVLGMSLLMSGCRVGNKDIIVSNNFSNRQVFKIGDMSCSLKEAKVYLANYQNIYGTAYGVNLWEHDFGDDSLTDYIKSVTIEELTQIVSMNSIAEEQEIALSEEELANVKAAAKEYYASLSDAEKEYLGVSEGDLLEYYSHYALAGKLYHSLTSSVNEEVSDDEARVIEIMQIFVSDRARAKQVAGRLKNGEDFAAVANNYNEYAAIQVTVSRDDLPDAVEEAAFDLDNGETSSQIAVENGYYFVKCLNKYNEELTEANKSKILEKGKKKRLIMCMTDMWNMFRPISTANCGSS